MSAPKKSTAKPRDEMSFKIFKIWAKTAEQTDVSLRQIRIIFPVLLLFSLISVTAEAVGTGRLFLAGQVDPQLIVTTAVDWTNWTLRLDNSSNVEGGIFWVQVDSTHRVLLDRTAIVDLASWVGRDRLLPGRLFQVTIASP